MARPSNHLVLLPLLTVAFLIHPHLATAQTQSFQRGVARMITHNATDPVRPVSGVQVVVGSTATKGSDARGRFTINVATNGSRTFVFGGVRLPKNSKLILVSPKAKTRHYLSKNDFELAFITTEERRTVSSATYQRLLNSYNKQAKTLRQLRDQIEEQQMEVDESSAAYARLKQQRDSVQALLLQYFDEKQRERILQELQRVADELAMTDYMSLDSLERRIFELKSAGEWSELTKLLRNVMNNDPEGYIQKKLDLKNMTRDELQQALRLFHENITSLKKQQLYDSASTYYALYLDADTADYAVLREAALFERDTLAHHELAATYFVRAIAHAPTDADRDVLRSELATTRQFLGMPAEATQQEHSASAPNGKKKKRTKSK